MDGSNSQQLVIVALPSEDDPVRRYSSEKEPHLTLLYLGQNNFSPEELTRVTDYVEYAASLFHIFGLDVVSRGELGDSKADVLFFNKNWTKSVSEFRDQLLQDPLISTAYNSSDQFPEWTPHLTMGFPEAPAKKDQGYDPTFYYVNFDRIALWTGDSTGPTFQLKRCDYGTQLAMSGVDTSILLSDVGEYVSHHGVKGMHWGIRKSDEGGSGSRSSAVNVESGINASTTKAAVEVAGLMRDRYGYGISNVKRIENSPHYNGTDIAFVENNRLAGGQNDGTIFVQSRDLTKIMKAAEPDWNAPGTGNPKGLLTHESAHALFHSNQVIKTSALGGQKVTGGDIKARDKALRAAEKAAAREGLTVWDTSGYTRTALERGELEAELFSQYHWGTDPPNFVKVWGETLHREMGIDPTPFKEVN